MSGGGFGEAFQFESAGAMASLASKVKTGYAVTAANHLVIWS